MRKRVTFVSCPAVASAPSSSSSISAQDIKSCLSRRSTPHVPVALHPCHRHKWPDQHERNFASPCSKRRRRCHRKRSRRQSSKGSIFPPLTTTLLFFHVAVFAAISFVPAGSSGLLPSSIIFAEGKEIVATNEWQKLEKDDTVPAGLHVKIDIGTGERWAKLPSDDDAENDEAIKGAVYNAEVAADGSVSAALAVNPDSINIDAKESTGGSEKDSRSSNKEQYQPGEPHYDYEMMHRTLSKLPDEEMERYGGLPALPGSEGAGTAHITPAERKAFEKKMAAIWQQRQEEIHNMQEEFMADMPKLLLKRIRYVQEYLANPAKHRADLAKERLARDVSNSEISGDDEDVVSNIVEVLNDIEYHVTDVDHARDFHTLGGWPVLASLLTDTAHFPTDAGNFTTNTGMMSNADRDIIDEIQSAAAWAIGTAVKNHEEFHSWALEDLSQAFGPASPRSITVVSLLLANIEALSNSGLSLPLSAKAQSKRQRCLYAISSLVRGNTAATKHFLDLDGPSILGSILKQISTTQDVHISASDAKFSSKILSLGDDLLGDILINRNGDTESDFNRRLIDSLTTENWCHAVVALVSKATSLQSRERSLIAMKSMTPYCQFSSEERKVVQKIGAELHGSAGDGELAQLDSDVKAEFVAIVDAILNEIETK